jgi:hypothetical protein
MPKNEKKSSPWLWTVLAVINVVGVAVPLSHYLQSDGEADAGGQIFAAVVLVCAVLFFVVVDGVTALLANFDVNEL